MCFYRNIYNTLYICVCIYIYTVIYQIYYYTTIVDSASVADSVVLNEVRLPDSRLFADANANLI